MAKIEGDLFPEDDPGCNNCSHETWRHNDSGRCIAIGCPCGGPREEDCE